MSKPLSSKQLQQLALDAIEARRSLRRRHSRVERHLTIAAVDAQLAIAAAIREARR